MQPHQQRVLEEREALKNRTEALYGFLAGQVFNTLDVNEQQLLKTQYYAMATYLQVLDMRIAKF